MKVMVLSEVGSEKWGAIKCFHVDGFTEPLLALEHFRKDFDKYALVVSDLRMPVMDGCEFIKQVKEIKPQVKIFSMSAFDSDYVEFRTELHLIHIDEFIENLSC
jgi:YesN/AraC family two-component response regulator